MEAGSGTQIVTAFAPGRKRVVVDDDVLLIETRTGKVLDILIDVIGGN